MHDEMTSPAHQPADGRKQFQTIARVRRNATNTPLFQAYPVVALDKVVRGVLAGLGEHVGLDLHEQLLDVVDHGGLGHIDLLARVAADQHNLVGGHVARADLEPDACGQETPRGNRHQ